MKTYSRKKPGEPQEVIIDLNDLCRLCMAKEDELVPIFSDEEAIPLALRIMACVSLEVFEGDGLPSKICHPCKFQLEKSYVFRKKCENSDQKLRQHLRSLQEKLGDAEYTVELNPKDEENESNSVENMELEESELNTEQDLVGVTQVAYIEPDPEPEEDPENITLPTETDNNKQACTLTTIQLKKEDEEVEGQDGDNYYIVGDDGEMEQFQQTTEQAIEDKDLDIIAEAVKSTLASHPDINLSGQLELKVDQQPGKATQVQVTTEDGSVIIVELLTEDGEIQAQLAEQEQDDDSPPQQSSQNTKYFNSENNINEDGELKVFHCPDCPKSFARRIQLRRHASVHMQQRGFSCGICEKWFPTRSALVRHERIHTGERPFQCEVCQKSFAQKEILFRHLMTHTGLKPYMCPHCDKGFTQKEPLRVHLKTHLNATPSDIMLHYCTLCPKVFCHASGLSRHLVTHTGKTFKCRDCDKSFTDKSSLRRHHRQTNHQE